MSGAPLKPDPLLYKERQAIADELTSSMRHDVRNRLSAIRNAAFYLKRRVSQTELWTGDARVQQFFALIDESVAFADKLLVAKFASPAADGADKPIRAASALARALDSARVAPEVSFDAAVDDAELHIGHDELALAVRCLLEGAAAGLSGAGVVRLKGSCQAGGYKVEVSPWTDASAATEADPISPGQRWEQGGEALGVHIAARVARCYGGSFEAAAKVEGGSACLTIPLEPREMPEVVAPTP
jgi:hypothetical protein